MLTFLAITGWLLSAFLALGLYSCLLNKDGWRKMYELERARCRELEHTRVCTEMDQDRMKWYREEHTRLSLKCAAICAQIRKMKGRGKSGVNPIHNF
jgi:hypothetical protein